MSQITSNLFHIQVPLQRSWEYLALATAPGASFKLLRSFSTHEMIKLELAAKVSLSVQPTASSEHLLYLLSGLITSAKTDLTHAVGTSFASSRLRQPLLLHTLGPVTLLYLSTDPAFAQLRRDPYCPELALHLAAPYGPG